MKTFNVYRHPILGLEAVKVGFSWPAAFFGPIWMAVKKLWVLFGVWFAMYVALSMVETVTDMSQPGIEQAALVYLLLASGYLLSPLHLVLKETSGGKRTWSGEDSQKSAQFRQKRLMRPFQKQQREFWQQKRGRESFLLNHFAARGGPARSRLPASDRSSHLTPR